MKQVPAFKIDPSLKSNVKVFSATKFNDRNSMGDQITRWLNQEPAKLVDDVVVKQSSDEAFHCLSIIYFYRTEVE
jgi:hypothetical protein